MAKARATPTAITVSPHGRAFAVTALDRRIRVFRFASGKLTHSIDDTPERYEAMHAAGTLPIDALDFGKRMAVEREYVAACGTGLRTLLMPPPPAPSSAAGGSRPPPQYRAPPSTAIFDSSGNFLLYPTCLGIITHNLVTDAVALRLGMVENTERFVAPVLFQGVPIVSSQYTLAKQAAGAGAGASADAEALAAASQPDPTLLVASYKRNRFYLFTRREPADVADAAGAPSRDVFNEAPSKEDLAIAAETAVAVTRAKLGSEAVIHTTRGDIFIELLGPSAPKAVENFTGHARAGYYAGHIFHRVIKGFMIQTGDPTGTGTGGESIWGRDFEDEIVPSLKFDRPGLVAMANAGPGTNGSQYFITTAACPWLNGKHTIFGRVVRGMEVVRDIESTATGPMDKPYDRSLKIVGVDVR